MIVKHGTAWYMQSAYCHTCWQKEAASNRSVLLSGSMCSLIVYAPIARSQVSRKVEWDVKEAGGCCKYAFLSVMPPMALAEIDRCTGSGPCRAHGITPTNVVSGRRAGKQVEGV